MTVYNHIAGGSDDAAPILAGAAYPANQPFIIDVPAAGTYFDFDGVELSNGAPALMRYKVGQVAPANIAAVTPAEVALMQLADTAALETASAVQAPPDLIFNGGISSSQSHVLDNGLTWQQAADTYYSAAISFAFGTDLYAGSFFFDDIVDGGSVRGAFNSASEWLIQSVNLADGQFTVTYSGGGTANVKIRGLHNRTLSLVPPGASYDRLFGNVYNSGGFNLPKDTFTPTVNGDHDFICELGVTSNQVFANLGTTNGGAEVVNNNSNRLNDAQERTSNRVSLVAGTTYHISTQAGGGTPRSSIRVRIIPA